MRSLAAYPAKKSFWMRNWVEQMTGAGAEMIEEEGIIANEAPDADAQAACEAAGKALAANA